MKTPSIILTALFVGATGAIAGTLFAPGKGKKTRKKIARRGQEYKDYFVDNYDNFAESVSHPIKTWKKK